MEDDETTTDTPIEDVIDEHIEDEVSDTVDNISDETPAVIVEGDTIFEAPEEVATPTDDLALGILVGQLTERVAALEGGVIYAVEVAEDAADSADEAAAAVDDVAEDTTEVIEDVIDNAEVVPGEHGEPDTLAVDNVEPRSSRVHPVFRSWSDWKDARNK